MGAPPSMSRQVLPMLFADLKKKELASSLYFTQHFSGILGRQPDSGLLDMSTVNRYEPRPRDVTTYWSWSVHSLLASWMTRMQWQSSQFSGAGWIAARVTIDLNAFP